MDNKGAIIFGVVIIALGALLLVNQYLPNQFDLFSGNFVLIGLGIIFLLSAFLTGRNGLAIPGCILAGIGGILYLQDLPGNWLNWTYAWTLIPGFVGVGILLSGLLDRSHPHFESGGLVLLAISAAGFLMFGGALGLGWDASQYWPVLLIVAGVVVLLSAIIRRK
jgi:hypothetical protein